MKEGSKGTRKELLFLGSFVSLGVCVCVLGGEGAVENTFSKEGGTSGSAAVFYSCRIFRVFRYKVGIG